MSRSTVLLWLKGLASAVIGGVASGVTGLIVAPDTFNDWAKLGKLMIVSAVVSAAMYLKASPMPVDPPVDPPKV